ncbi:MAG: HAD-IC family P-type ATPase [Deltaproteobacteria bacterium]|nr:HAD-IC family P-type ATPase [Deltaproteobacteria bacterium]
MNNDPASTIEPEQNFSTENTWYQSSLQDIFSQLQSGPEGLEQKEAQSRLKKFGLNKLPRQATPKFSLIFLRQFKSPLIYILLAATIVSLFIQELTDAAFIAFVLILNSAIGSYQEWKAEKSNRALEKLLQLKAAILRNDEISEIDAENIVRGDIIWLESGNRVPADVRLLFSQGFEVDQSALTGESLAASKDAEWKAENETSMADQQNMVYAGATVARGRAKGIVVATGSQTLLGQMALDILSSQAGKAPLILRLEKFSRSIGIWIVIASILTGLVGALHHFSISEMFLVGVALAVAAIPEGLPVAITIALAIASKRMAKRGVIVRKLAAVEGLGSCTYIGSDKTGTLTVNALTVKEVRLANGKTFQVSGQGFEPKGEILFKDQEVNLKTESELTQLLYSAVLCNEASLHRCNQQWIWHGESTDIALLSLGEKAGLSREQLLEHQAQIHQIPFESENQFAASFHETQNDIHIYVKGAPERIIAMSSLKQNQKEQLHQIIQQMAEQGYRILAIASAKIEKCAFNPSSPQLNNLNFLGFLGMLDPLRDGVRQSIQCCREAGIFTSMITGDHPITALAIAKQLDLAKDMSQVLTGEQLSKLSEAELRESVKNIRVFARVTPVDKQRIVQAARKIGNFVAVTGDGVNDAPALRDANIGVAMGKGGTDVARDASDIVISDDNFNTIVAGVEEGRVAYDNVRKVIYFLISTGATEVIMVACAILLGLPLPLLPVQLLWLNLVTSGIQDVTLAFEPSEGNVLKRKPRSPQEAIFNRLMIERMLVGAGIMSLLGLGTFYFLLQYGFSESEARNGLLLLMVLFENFHLGNCRSETQSAFVISPLRSPLLLSGAVAALSIHILLMHVSFGQKILQMHPIRLEMWVMLISLALIIVVAMELHKWIWHKRYSLKNS